MTSRLPVGYAEASLDPANPGTQGAHMSTVITLLIMSGCGALSLLL